MKKYGSEIIDLILSGTGAKAVCTVLGLCLGHDQELTVPVQAEGAEGLFAVEPLSVLNLVEAFTLKSQNPSNKEAASLKFRRVCL